MQRPLLSPAGTPAAGPATSPDARLQGVNLGDWLVAGAPLPQLRGFIEAGDFARLVSWRFTHVRLPVDAPLLDTLDGWVALDRALVTAVRYGLRCVVALRLPASAHPALFAGPGAWQGLLERWETIAKRYQDAPELLSYDLLDHPMAPDTLSPETLTALGVARVSPTAARRPAPPGATGARAWNALATKLTHAIRAHDDRHTIVVQSHEASAVAFAHLRPTRDPNTLYSFHCFDPRAFTQQGLAGHNPIERGFVDQGATGQDAADRGASPFVSPAHPVTYPVTYPGTIDGQRWDRARLQELLGPALEFRRVYEAPVYVGAFGVAAGAPRAGQLTWLRTVLSLCRAHGLGWAYWTYKGGPFGLAADSRLAGAGIRPERYGNPLGLDYDLLGVLQSEA